MTTSDRSKNVMWLFQNAKKSTQYGGVRRAVVVKIQFHFYLQEPPLTKRSSVYPQVVLETEITNKSALKLYENLGFVRDKRLFRYYLNGVDALRLKLWLR